MNTKKLSRKQKEIEARRAADPIAQALERNDIDYGTDELPTAPRVSAITQPEPVKTPAVKHCATCTCE